MTEMTGSRAFVKSLENEGVEHIFGVSGGALIPICDDLLDSDMRFILARHEQGSTHMADGYARVLNKVGVCIATSGPGATNVVTGLATAQIDSSPVVAFTGQVNRLRPGNRRHVVIGPLMGHKKLRFHSCRHKHCARS
ncbi:MAG: thiamine pyrophosphate-binding protein, partial [Candidatus Bathyarchaeota archaeon]